MPSLVPGPLSEGPLKVGETFIGQYEILALIGSGGHAFVYRARHRFLGHLVALKVLHRPAGVSLEMLRRGQAEAQIEFQLNHPGIVTVKDAGLSDDGLLYIVMELLHGRPVRDAILELGKLTLREALWVLRSLAEAMQVAHAAGVVHRDLKPENLFFTAKQALKVVDFGVAKIDDIAGWQTRKDHSVGTLYYMSPEQALGLPVSPRTDIYAAGVIFWELVIGMHPVIYQLGERPAGVGVLSGIICKEAVPALDSVDPTIPAHVAGLIAQATAKAPDKRFGTMDELAKAASVCEALLDAEEKRLGRVTSVRDLSRKAPASSGVANTGASAAADEQDTAPASRPLILGALPSLRAPKAAAPAPLNAVAQRAVSPAPRSAAPSSAPSSADRPTLFSRTGAGNTAPLHAPAAAQSRPPLAAVPAGRAAPTPGQASPAPGKAAGAASVRPLPQPSRDSASAPAPLPHKPTARPRQETPIELPLSGIGIVPLLWGLAAGILIFGLGAFFFLRTKPNTAPTATRALPSAAPAAPSSRRPTTAQAPAPVADITPPPPTPKPSPAAITESPGPTNSGTSTLPSPKPASSTKSKLSAGGDVTPRDISKMDRRVRSKEAGGSKEALPASGLEPEPVPPNRRTLF